MAEPWFLYILRCADDTLYTGVSNDVAKRLSAHQRGKGARYTRGRGPLLLLVTRRCLSKSHALKLEIAVKQQSRAQKERLVEPGRLSRFARSLGYLSRATRSGH
jgi:putative endonuclease